MKMCVINREIELKSGTVAAILVAAILVGCVIGYVFFSGGSDIIIEAGEETDAGKVTGDISGNDVKTGEEKTGGASPSGEDAGNSVDAAADGQKGKPSEKIKVYVVGCVKNPGIVEIEKGQLIDDAVRLAGGFTDEADAENINLVYPLYENVMLCIKSKQAMKIAQNDETALQHASVNNGTKESSSGNSAGKSVKIVRDSGAGAEVIGNGDKSESANGGSGNMKKVNINTAGVEELDTLPGIGEATAKEIIAYREKNGNFKKIEDIMKVPRIKQNRFESIKDFITVE